MRQYFIILLSTLAALQAVVCFICTYAVIFVCEGPSCKEGGGELAALAMVSVIGALVAGIGALMVADA